MKNLDQNNHIHSTHSFLKSNVSFYFETNNKLYKKFQPVTQFLVPPPPPLFLCDHPMSSNFLLLYSMAWQTFCDLHTRLHLFHLISHVIKPARCNYLLSYCVIYAYCELYTFLHKYVVLSPSEIHDFSLRDFIYHPRLASCS